ncbi:MAG: hypothetical protein L6R42_006550, partial [Xanthoria sp. 1 TBL-2021]
MERFVPRDRKSPDVQTAEVSEDEISCADPDPQPLIPRDGLSIIAASFAGGQTKAGVDLGPSALLNNEFNLLNHLSKTWHIQQTSLSPHSFPPSPIIHHSGMSNLRLVSNYTHQLALQAYTHVRNN